MSLKIDKDRRVAFKGQMSFAFRTYPDFLALDNELLALLLQDAKVAMTARQAGDGTSGLSEGQTFFVSANEEPRCGLEAMARAIFDFHTAGLEGFDPSSSGAEWWTQYVDDRDDIGFHLLVLGLFQTTRTQLPLNSHTSLPPGREPTATATMALRKRVSASTHIWGQ